LFSREDVRRPYRRHGALRRRVPRQERDEKRQHLGEQHVVAM
jgi:hypothetical protein